ncbi:formate dehydrogenase subunit gamma [Caenispirillum bisanense]|uniref:formate dehydrogenase subunit gamma n=1 Tax=Caenispirillum bisanense TaxID=414052 RepID=UPI0031D46236
MAHRAFPPLMALFSVLLVLALLAVATPAPALAQQTIDAGVGSGTDVIEPTGPGLERQTPGAVTEENFQLVIPDQKQVGRISIPDEKLATLVQPQGRDWRTYRMTLLVWGGAIVILGMLAALGLFFLIRGRIRLDEGFSGRLVQRFDGLDRFAHWTSAVSFLLLAITGLIITFGRHVLIPLIGHQAFMPVVDVSKYIHNYAAIPFVFGILLMLALWVKDNIPNREDLLWIKDMGGLLGKGGSHHPDAGRFNAGQKAVFWGMVLGGLVMAGTGLSLLVPFALGGVNTMQLVHVVHAALGMLLIAGILAHIYIGTLGMEGAFDAMGKGEVDENWARAHHRGWYEAQRDAGAVSDPNANRSRR